VISVLTKFVEERLLTAVRMSSGLADINRNVCYGSEMR